MRVLLTAALMAGLAAGAAHADSLFNQGASRAGTLIAEKKARFEPGDIITVQVEETISASVTADTNTRKESDVESTANPNANTAIAGEDGFNFISPGKLPNWNIGADNETRTRGQTRRQSTLRTTVTCVVKEVYPNDTLLIEGERTVTVNREDSKVQVRGVVRAQDVTPANTVQSAQLAQASVHLEGKGPLWNNQRRGWITRALDWISPF